MLKSRLDTRKSRIALFLMMSLVLILTLWFVGIQYFMECRSLAGHVKVVENRSANYPFLDAPEKPGKLHIPATQFIGDKDGWYIKMCEAEATSVYYGGLPTEDEDAS